MGDSRMDSKAKRIIDDLESLIEFDYANHPLDQCAEYATDAESALKTIKAACGLIADQSDRIEKQNREIIHLEASAGASDHGDDIDNLKTMLQCENRIRKLTDQNLFLSGQISVYDRLFASVFEDDSPQADI